MNPCTDCSDAWVQDLLSQNAWSWSQELVRVSQCCIARKLFWPWFWPMGLWNYIKKTTLVKLCADWSNLSLRLVMWALAINCPSFHSTFCQVSERCHFSEGTICVCEQCNLRRATHGEEPQWQSGRLRSPQYVGSFSPSLSPALFRLFTFLCADWLSIEYAFSTAEVSIEKIPSANSH